MCGRFVLATPPDRLAEYFAAHPSESVSFAASWNVAPRRDVLGVALDRAGERELAGYRWGLVPSYASDPSVGNRLVNARAESLATRPAFRAAFSRRRLLVLADGFYEWRRDEKGGRQPYYFCRRDGAPIAFAGLFELWRPRDGDSATPWLRSCTIVTTDAGPDVAAVHDRMPVVLEPTAQEAWLEVAAPELLSGLLTPSPAGTLQSWAIGRAVGDVRNDRPELLEPLPLDGASEAPRQLLLPLGDAAARGRRHG
ncbi:MAG: SOS response-associated peptidase [Actinomycetota bacterium]|nr:SOS response-associated peptidase [Actinomycetota bacterium]